MSTPYYVNLIKHALHAEFPSGRQRRLARKARRGQPQDRMEARHTETYRICGGEYFWVSLRGTLGRCGKKLNRAMRRWFKFGGVA